MIRNHWYAVEFAERLGAEPLGARIMGYDLVLYRTADGGVVAQSDVCIHRGGPLSGGRVVDDCVECPYHGWRFDTSGTCVVIPANREGLPIPKKARVDTYPAEERYGYIWVFLGDLAVDERPDIAPLPHLTLTKGAHKIGYRAVTGEFTWNANYERVIENAVDISHTPFVHSGSFGNREQPEIEEFEIDDTEQSALATVHLTPPPAPGLWSRLYRTDGERPPIKTTTGLFFPNMSMLEVNLPLGQMVIFTAAVPVDEHTTISKFTMLRNFFTGRWADADAKRRTLRIFKEDQMTVEGQRPELLPIDLAAELHVRSDAIQLAYRRWRRKNLDAGLGLPAADTSEAAGVIPSPARRDPELADSWVIPEAVQ